MRQQQNNKNRARGRGRNQNNKSGNSLNRNYESNGPDVKIRGNAAHIAEKYQTLARDALSSGDRVVAENYLQHAEHYNRIVLAANAQREEQLAAQRANQQDTNPGDQPSGEGVESGAEASDNGGRGQDRRPRRRDARVEDRAGERDAKSEDRDETGEDQSVESKQNGSDDVDEAAAEAAPAPKPKRKTSRKKEEVPEGITEDAANLPQGLLGGASAREAAPVDE